MRREINHIEHVGSVEIFHRDRYRNRKFFFHHEEHEGNEGKNGKSGEKDSLSAQRLS